MELVGLVVTKKKQKQINKLWFPIVLNSILLELVGMLVLEQELGLALGLELVLE